MTNRTPLWLLQRIQSAETCLINSDIQRAAAQQLIDLAKNTMQERIQQGEELSYPEYEVNEILVDAKGQCLMNTMKVFNNVNTLPEVMRQDMLNHLMSFREKTLVGLSPVKQVFKDEYNVNLEDEDEFARFRTEYCSGSRQSGIMELLVCANNDHVDYLVCSVVVENSRLLPVAYFPAYDLSTEPKEMRMIKGGSITEEQSRMPWFVLESGAIIHPVAAERLSHFNPLLPFDKARSYCGLKHTVVTELFEPISQLLTEVFPRNAHANNNHEAKFDALTLANQNLSFKQRRLSELDSCAQRCNQNPVELELNCIEHQNKSKVRAWTHTVHPRQVATSESLRINTSELAHPSRPI